MVNIGEVRTQEFALKNPASQRRTIPHGWGGALDVRLSAISSPLFSLAAKLTHSTQNSFRQIFAGRFEYAMAAATGLNTRRHTIFSAPLGSLPSSWRCFLMRCRECARWLEFAIGSAFGTLLMKKHKQGKKVNKIRRG